MPGIASEAPLLIYRHSLCRNSFKSKTKHACRRKIKEIDTRHANSLYGTASKSAPDDGYLGMGG